MKAKHCKDCPKWGSVWCSIYARRQPGSATACEYGKKLMHSDYMRIYMQDYNKKGKGVK